MRRHVAPLDVLNVNDSSSSSSSSNNSSSFSSSSLPSQHFLGTKWFSKGSKSCRSLRWALLILFVVSGWLGLIERTGRCSCAPRGSVCISPLNRKGVKPFAEYYSVSGTVAVFKVRNLIHSEQSDFQKIEVYETGFFGRILVIDGDLMLTEKDEKHYHEMIAHVPLVYASSALSGDRADVADVVAPPVKTSTAFTPLIRVLIVGGGDGGTLREVLRHADVKEVTLVDIDERVINVSKAFFPELTTGFSDPRANVVVADGAKFVAAATRDQSQTGSYDVVIVDSTDFAQAVPLFGTKFYANVRLLLKPQTGILVFNVDTPSFAMSTVADAQKQLAQVFKYSYIYQVFQPTYLSGHYAFLFASDGVHPFRTPVHWSTRWTPKRIATQYYQPDLHYASFVLPSFARKALPVNYDDGLKLKDIVSLPTEADMDIIVD